MKDNIATFFYNLFLPTYTTEEVIRAGASFTAKSQNEKWLYYWIGDFKTGFEVKVSVDEQIKYLRTKGRK